VAGASLPIQPVALVLALALAGAASAQEPALELERGAGVSDAERVRRAVAYTVASQRPTGLFAYDFDVPSAEPTGQDNLVRQAGTLFVLGEFLLEERDARVEAALRTGLEAMGSLSLPIARSAGQELLEAVGVFSLRYGRVERQLDRLGLLYAREGPGRVVAAGGDYERALTGTTALALLAALEYERATGDARFAGLRDAWTEGLLVLQLPAGRGVRMRPTTLETSPYFDGETWLAFAAHRDAFAEHAGVGPALEALERVLMERFAAEPASQFFHWGAMASARRYRATGEVRFADFAAQQASWFLGAVPFERGRHQTTCSQVEGLASVAATLADRPEHEALLARVRDRARRELERNRRLQVEPGQERLDLAGGGVLLAPVLAEHAGAFLAGPYRAYFRTDLNQHCISAFLKARRVGLGASESATRGGGADPPR
jgi:hypothetical protein